MDVLLHVVRDSLVYRLHESTNVRLLLMLLTPHPTDEPNRTSRKFIFDDPTLSVSVRQL